MARQKTSAKKQPVVNGTNKKPTPIVIDLDQIDFEPITRTGYSRLLKAIEDYKAERAEKSLLISELRQGGTEKSANDGIEVINFRIGVINGKINELKAFRACVEFIDELGVSDDGLVGIGRVVTLSSNGTEYDYAILGLYESNAESIMSFEAPLAQMLKGHKVGETITYDGTEITIKGIRMYREGETI